MRVAVFGAGALGSVVGGLLSRRNEVTLIGRSAHMQAIEHNGLVVGGMVEAVFVPQAVSEVSQVHEVDIVIVTVKAYDTLEALEAVRPLLDKGAVLVLLQNGLRQLTVMSEGHIGSIIGITSIGATYVSPGKVVYTGIGDTYFGSLSGATEQAERIAEMFTSVGLDSEVPSDIRREVWAKAVINASINPITALVRCRNGGVLKNEGLLALSELLCDEGVSVARAQGIELSAEQTFEKVLEVLRRTAENRSSMLQDMERGKRTEVDDINGEIVRLGKEKGIDARTNRALTLLIEGLSAQNSRR
jgi:2-dehydropantoate 2-reductase